MPRFPQWRGVLLDVGRHFFPVSFVKRFIDLIALHKINRLHWHLTEDQGWRIEIKAFPRLTEVGAWRTGDNGERVGGFYTQDEVRDIVRYAQERFVEIVPEIEMPGHCCAALASYPHLSCRGNVAQVPNRWGVFSDVYCAGNDDVFAFLERGEPRVACRVAARPRSRLLPRGYHSHAFSPPPSLPSSLAVLEEVLGLFPSRYIHIGGDECPKEAWAACPKCQERIVREKLRDEDALQSWFIARMQRWLAARGRQLVGWDEILEGGLPEGTTVMSWRGVAGGLRAAQLGHEVIMTPASHVYLDYKQGPAQGEPGAWYAVLPLEAVYMFDPVPHYDMYCSGHGLPAWCDTEAMRAWRGMNFPEAATPEPEVAANIIGAQANLWTEYVQNETTVEYMLLPRLCAFAEAVWSRPHQRDWASFRARLAPLLELFDALGVRYRPLDAPAGDQGASACVAAGPSSKAPTEDEHLSEEHVSSHAVTPVDMQAAIV